MEQREAPDWTAHAAELKLPTSMVVGGEEVAARTGRTMSVVSPRNGSVLGVVPDADAADVDRAVAAARRAFESSAWRGMAPAERKRILHRFADLIEKHREELALLVCLEMGKPIDYALSIEMRSTVACYRWYAEWADKMAGESPDVGASALALVTREPVGVVGAIVPWNFPMTLLAWKIAPALAVGCTVVVRPSELSPFSAIRVAELGVEAGLPPGVLNVVVGDGRRSAEALGRHSDVDALAFTGSTEVGRSFMHYSAESNLKRVWLELGGKSPSIVLPDADLDVAIAETATNIFFNQGEMCSAPSRLLVHRSVHDQVVAGVVAVAEGLRIGDPLNPTTQLGPLVTSAHRDRVEDLVSRGVQEGATLRTGGGSRPTAVDPNGFYIRPSVLTEVEPQMTIAREEVFGPVLSVLSFGDEDDAVRLANDSDYGLAAAVWTSDISAAHRVSRRLRAGTVWVNCYEEADITVPFGGYGQSGNGRDKSKHALEEYTELKTTWIKL